MYHLEFPQYTTKKDLVNNFHWRFYLLDDILVKYYAFVPHLLLQYI